MSNHPISIYNPLVLASISPRRKAILKQIGIPFEAVASRVVETLNRVMTPDEMACQMAMHKGKSVHHLYQNRWILGADTIVVLNEKVFGKPRDAPECREMLHYLSGKNHRVITGFCIVDPSGTSLHIEAVTTEVKIKALAEQEIDTYVKTGEPFGKAGGYAIQGIGSFMIEYIRGSYTNVVGLPVCEVVASLVKCGGLAGFPLIE